MSNIRKLAYGEAADTPLNLRLALEEAARCLLCEDAPCSRDCPAETDPGKFIRSIRFKNFKGAAETIRTNNILGATCAMICPYDKLCENACSRTGIDKPIQIGKLQQFAMEQEKIFNMNILEKSAPRKEKVLCIGAGPASLACAAKLAQNGINVHIIDKHEKPGGVLRYGITPSRLSDDTVDQDIDKVRKLGVTFEQNRRVSASELETLKKQYDAVFIGVGLWDSKTIPSLQKMDITNAESAINFLKRARQAKGNIPKLGNVVIVGGGDVAMDCASTAKQLGAESVYVVFLESIEEMPANKNELQYIISLGIHVVPQFIPAEIHGPDKDEAISFKSVKNNSKIKLDADNLIFAIGQKAENDYAEIKNDKALFYAGDIVNKGKTVVHAVAEGKEAAAKIIDYLNNI